MCKPNGNSTICSTHYIHMYINISKRNFSFGGIKFAMCVRNRNVRVYTMASRRIHVSIHTTVGLFHMVAFQRRDLPPLGETIFFFFTASLSLSPFFIYYFFFFTFV